MWVSHSAGRIVLNRAGVHMAQSGAVYQSSSYSSITLSMSPNLASYQSHQSPIDSAEEPDFQIAAYTDDRVVEIVEHCVCHKRNDFHLRAALGALERVELEYALHASFETYATEVR